MSAPERTCVVCRKKADKSMLLRFVVGADGKFLVDEKQKLPGRGAYTHTSCKNSKQVEAKLMYGLKKIATKKS